MQFLYVNHDLLEIGPNNETNRILNIVLNYKSIFFNIWMKRHVLEIRQACCLVCSIFVFRCFLLSINVLRKYACTNTAFISMRNACTVGIFMKAKLNMKKYWKVGFCNQFALETNISGAGFPLKCCLNKSYFFNRFCMT